MKKIVPLLLVIGIAIIGFIFLGNPGKHFSKDNDFQIADTAAVNRIEIISKDTIILTRNETGWVLEDGQPAGSVSVNNLLFSFQRIGVKGVSTTPDITEGMAIRIKIFEGKKKHLARLYNFNGVTYMHKEGAKNFYSVEVNGFPEINLSEVVNPDPDHWKDKILLNLKASEILSVSVVHPADPAKDFHIKLSGEKFMLFGGDGQTAIPDSLIKKEKLDFYLSYFGNIFYDYTEYSEIQPGQQPGWIVSVEDVTGRKYDLKVYFITTGSGNDMFRALVKYNNQPGYKLTRFMLLDLILQDKEHFLKNISG